MSHLSLRLNALTYIAMDNWFWNLLLKHIRAPYITSEGEKLLHVFFFFSFFQEMRSISIEHNLKARFSIKTKNLNKMNEQNVFFFSKA